MTRTLFVVGVVVLALKLATLLAGCTPRPERPACAAGTLASIEAAYVAEAITLCQGQTFETCKELPALEAKYAAQREEWIACR